MNNRWIDLAGAVNCRDLGGLPTVDGGITRFGRLIRSDNLQSLTVDDVDRLSNALRVRHILDLRSSIEVDAKSPGPMASVAGVTIHRLSLFPEPTGGDTTTPPWLTGAHPSIWTDRDAHYLAYLQHRPDNIVSALRTIATSDGAVVVHCAAGKDRTGVVCAIALSTVGVEPDAVIADYVQTADRIEAILKRLAARDNLIDYAEGRPATSHLPQRDTMVAFLERLETDFGGAAGWLQQHGWTPADTDLLRTRLLA